jgi:hypothetical protein
LEVYGDNGGEEKDGVLHVEMGRWRVEGERMVELLENE